MGKTSLAVDTLERLAVQLSGIQDAAMQLREVGSYEDAIADLAKQREALLNEVGSAKRDLALSQQQTTALVDEATANAERLLAEAEGKLQEATTHAQQLIDAAQAQAAANLEADKAAREALLKDLQKQVEVERKKLNDLQGKAVVAAKDADAIEQRVGAAHQALEHIQAQARALTGLQ